VGQLVTITNTLNANGQLNVTEASITVASGGTTGTFSIDVALPDFTFAPEDALASTAGTVFCFDPGAALSGNPIHGTGTGGTLVFNSKGLSIDPGTYQGSVFFITRNGYYTSPAPPVTFTVTSGTTNIQVSEIPIGPPNVVMRGITLTEAGQLGVPGANFFTLPAPVDFYFNNTKYTATSFFVPDNLSSSYSLFLPVRSLIERKLSTYMDITYSIRSRSEIRVGYAVIHLVTSMDCAGTRFRTSII